MAKATAKEVPGSESESELSKSAKKSTTASKNASNNKERSADAEEEVEMEDSGSEEEGEEEYEIETILDAKQGMFPEGRAGYLVKWKGYEEEHNSWVDEKDAPGAKELIEEYWRKNSKKNGGRKSDVKPKPAAKPRKTTATKDESDEEPAQAATPAPPAKKRGRPSKSQARAASEDHEENEENAVPKKKQRKSIGGAGAKGAKRVAATEVQEDDDVYTDMRKWKNLDTWEHLVDTIDTVERTDNNELLVYFTLKHGKGQGRETSDICKHKIPYKLIEFYESNLRWKPTNDDAMEE